ncbi:translation factor guf1-related [Holotrichia oblita]|nr:translation factor guf1-related [Holotrichia oblita]
MDDNKKIRNFCIIAHIDHGKSTLADRLIEKTGTVSQRELSEQILDSMELEKERGITIKLTPVRMFYNYKGEEYLLNLIDTPGHVDFTYEVSRSLAACEGAILVVDAAQGVEAQTLANVYLALDNNLEILPVINKIDLPSARPDEVKKEIEDVIGLDASMSPLISAKEGLNIGDVLDRIIELIPPPTGKTDMPLKALIFDSYYDNYKGAVCLIRVFDGILKPGMKVRMMAAKKEYEVTEIGIFNPKPISTGILKAGQVGYLCASIKNVADTAPGDTITNAENPTKEPLPGYKKVQPVVYSGIFPVDGSRYNDLKDALDKLKLNDASLSFEQENSAALGFGFRCGFLGLLHMEIIQERLEREFNLDLITTAPSVIYHVYKKNGDMLTITNPTNLPQVTEIDRIEEPIVGVFVYTPPEYIGTIMELCQEKRGVFIDMTYLDKSRVRLKYDIPLNEIIYDFFDGLKSRTRGYASMDYELKGYVSDDLIKLDILLNNEICDALSIIVHRERAYARGRNLAERLKETIPRQLFEIPIQAAIGGKVIARETVKALRKDVLAKCYGGDISRKKKLLEKQKEGKKRMHKDTEFTVETNPESCDERFLSECCKTGINRLSIGLQSCDDRILRGAGRLHNFDDFCIAFKKARDFGIKNISSDLILGLRGENEQTFRSSIEKLIDLSPEHISVYALKCEQGTKLFDSGFLPDDDFVSDLYDIAVVSLANSGYNRYEEHKELTVDLPIQKMPLPSKIYLPIEYRKEPEIFVKAGDEVAIGTLVARGIVNVFSSCCGKVVEIITRPGVGGKLKKYVVIETNNDGTSVTLPPLTNPTPDEIIERVIYCGITGMGGAGFPTGEKLKSNKKIEYFLINGAECEAYITCDNRVMIEHTKEVIEGAILLRDAAGARVAIIAVEDNKQEAIRLLKEMIVNYKNVEICVMKTKYPQGDARRLIYSATGIKIPQNKRTTDCGVMVNNVHTAYTVYRAVQHGIPSYSRIMTVSGGGIRKPGNYWVANGTLYTDLIEFCGGMDDENTVRIISGGPMMGTALLGTEYATGNATGSLLLLTAPETIVRNSSACINCAKCAKVCPANLMPMYIDLYTRIHDFDTAKKYGAEFCIECGCCAYGKKGGVEMSEAKLILSEAPHVTKSGNTTVRLMRNVLIALLPAVIAATYYFGLMVIVNVISCVFFCAFFELLYNLLEKKEFSIEAIKSSSIWNLSCAITGVILALSLPVKINLFDSNNEAVIILSTIFAHILGSFMSIIIAKMLFGGIGRNFVNPALIGRVFLIMCFSKAIITVSSANGLGLTAVTGATWLRSDGTVTPDMLLQMFIGNRNTAAVGETCAVAILIGYLILCLTKTIDFKVPLLIIGSMAIFTLLFEGTKLHGIDIFYNMLAHLLSGGILFAAVFMATDYATSPNTKTGLIIYALGIGSLNVMIRSFSSGYPEGVTFAILIMNLFVPIIDKYIVPKPFGLRRKHD